MSKKILAVVVLSVLTPLAMAAKPITSNSNGEYTDYPLDVQRVQTTQMQTTQMQTTQMQTTQMQTTQMQTAQGQLTNVRVDGNGHAEAVRGAAANRDVSLSWHHDSSENGEWTTYPAPGY